MVWAIVINRLKTWFLDIWCNLVWIFIFWPEKLSMATSRDSVEGLQAQKRCFRRFRYSILRLLNTSLQKAWLHILVWFFIFCPENFSIGSRLEDRSEELWKKALRRKNCFCVLSILASNLSDCLETGMKFKPLLITDILDSALWNSNNGLFIWIREVINR